MTQLTEQILNEICTRDMGKPSKLDFYCNLGDDGIGPIDIIPTINTRSFLENKIEFNSMFQKLFDVHRSSIEDCDWESIWTASKFVDELPEIISFIANFLSDCQVMENNGDGFNEDNYYEDYTYLISGLVEMGVILPVTSIKIDEDDSSIKTEYLSRYSVIGDDFINFIHFMNAIIALNDDSLTINDDVRYTYNMETALNQDFQYIQFYIGDNNYILLQTHTGVDARVGFSKIYAFDLTYHDDILASSLSRYVIESCREFSDGGWHAVQWSFFNNYNEHSTLIKHFPDGSVKEKHIDFFNQFMATDQPELRGRRYIYIDDDRNLYCPYTGEKLELYFE